MHVGVVMDGNGRWAERQGLPRSAGHRAGALTVRRIVEAAPSLGIDVLTLYAFSSDNWRRPPSEVQGLFGLFRSYLRAEAARCARAGVRLSVIGRRDRLPARLVEAVAAAETATQGASGLRLRIALDYSGRDAIRRAAHAAAGRETTLDELGELIARVDHSAPVPPADLLIRTGGERRLSDFLLWEAAYAELFFVETMWPDFTARELAAVIAGFGRRERRFGGLAASMTETAAASAVSSDAGA